MCLAIATSYLFLYRNIFCRYFHQTGNQLLLNRNNFERFLHCNFCTAWCRQFAKTLTRKPILLLEIESFVSRLSILKIHFLRNFFFNSSNTLSCGSHFFSSICFKPRSKNFFKSGAILPQSSLKSFFETTSMLQEFRL